jgi:hypothetical protein
LEIIVKRYQRENRMIVDDTQKTMFEEVA